MKRSLLATLALVVSSLSVQADTLTTAAPAYASPSPDAPILGTAQIGSRLVTSPAPSGWQAVELAGPHAVFVTEADTLKNFQVRPGAAYYSAPGPDAPVMGLAGNEDPAEFADIVGRYNKFSLNKPLVAYVLVPVTTVVALAPAPEPAVVVAAAPAPIAEWSESFPADTTATLREDIPARSPVASGQTSELGEPGLARTFFGTVASTRNPLRPRRPFDFQLLDEGGSRIAYLDVSRLMLTERVEAFLGRPVTLFGLAEPLGISGNEIVIRVETFKLQ